MCSRSASVRRSVFISGVTRAATKGGAAIDQGVLNKSSREAILHRFDFAHKLNTQNTEFVDPGAETPTDS
jgi:hypothetical protein